jgi:hypothetical protein
MTARAHILPIACATIVLAPQRWPAHRERPLTGLLAGRFLKML